ncbi:MAG: deoxyribose-phosphate aldolase [Hyphomicrobiales bacterium]|nr:deoxyribose-phosphate aldolase [Hyphomicrobiales bacterium]
MTDARALALRAIPLIDLTDLSDTCSEHQIEALTRRALSLDPTVAALCIWPQFVSGVRTALRGSVIRLATVINFPKGSEDVERAVSDAQEALSDGANEIDLVMPYRAFLAGRIEPAREMISAVADCLPRGALLKVILETGELGDAEHIAQASRLAIECGAHFLKTSTGKTKVSATPEAARVMLTCIRDSARPVGFKASGGLRTLADAAVYLALADEVMGTGWASPQTFRFGASSLLDALLAAVEANPA